MTPRSACWWTPTLKASTASCGTRPSDRRNLLKWNVRWELCTREGRPSHGNRGSPPFIIGGGGDYNWQGKVDEVMLFRKALSIDEIEKLMIAGSPASDGSNDE